MTSTATRWRDSSRPKARSASRRTTAGAAGSAGCRSTSAPTTRTCCATSCASPGWVGSTPSRRRRDEPSAGGLVGARASSNAASWRGCCSAIRCAVASAASSRSGRRPWIGGRSRCTDPPRATDGLMRSAAAELRALRRYVDPGHPGGADEHVPHAARPTDCQRFLGGFFTGEGSFSLRGRAMAGIHLRADDADLVRSFGDAFGIGRVSVSTPTRRRPPRSGGPSAARTELPRGDRDARRSRAARSQAA